MDQLENIISEQKHQLISSLQQLIQFNSVEGESKEGMPFGKGVDDALKFVLNLGKEFGFKAVYKDGYYGYIEMGEGEELIGLAAHLDVVPVEKAGAWIFPPFSGKIANNRIYGRGSIDDKGPLLAALYAMKAVREAKLPLKKRIRLILGTNEETGWKCINKYLKEEEIPAYGFIPDSDFPLINAEKGLLQIRLTSKEKVNFTMTGGTALNSVPDSCRYTGEKTEGIIAAAHASSYNYNSEGNTFTLLGKTAHSAKTWEGINAIVRTAILLFNNNISSPIIDFIAQEVGEDVYAREIFDNYDDTVSGKLTFNVAKINIDKDLHEIYLDIRIPVLKEKEEVLSLLKRSTSKYKLELEVLDSLPPLYVPEDHPLVQTLRMVYEEVVQQNSTPLSTGGATYARGFKNFVAFGPLFPGEEKMAHKQNEYMNIDSLMKCFLIYAKAIASLGQ